METLPIGTSGPRAAPDKHHPVDNQMLEAALACARRGWSVFPIHTVTNGRCSCSSSDCDSSAKHPRTKHGFKDATTDQKQIRAWWRTWPNANLGIATGTVSGIVVLDIDKRNGGHDTIADFEAIYGSLPVTVEATTGGDGRHVLFRYRGGDVRSRSGIAPGLDIKADDGYIVAAPSLHVSGKRYSWVEGRRPDDVELAELPAWLASMVVQEESDGHSGKVEAADSLILAGQRNSHLASLAGALRRKGMGESAIRAALIEENRTRCTPPLRESEVEHVAKSIARYKPEFTTEIHETELGLAQRFVLRYGQDLRFCFPWKSWLVWDGMRWAHDQAGQVWSMLKEVVHEIYEEAVAESDAKQREAMLRYAIRCEKEATIRAALKLAQSDVAVHPEELNRDRWLLNTPTAVVDLKTGSVREHRREDLITKLCPTPYDSNAKCPMFERFLLRVMDQNVLLILYLQRIFGYALTGTVREHVIFFLIGLGANGKSTLVGAVSVVVGSDYAAQIAPNLLFVQRKDSHPTSIADLYGKRFAVTHELDSGTRLAEGIVKQMTGGDRIRARRMHENYWEFDPTHTLFLCANSKPVIRGSDDGIWRRIRLVPFRVQIPREEQDRDLGDKLAEEAPGILRWLVEGAREWAEAGLDDPEEVLAATADYRSENDVIGEFLAAKCQEGKGLKVKAKELYEAYTEWHQDVVGGDPISQKVIGRALSDQGFTRKRGGDGAYEWRGLELR